MIVLLVLSLSLPLITGYLLARAFVPEVYPRPAYHILCTSIGAGLGLGLSSCVYFINLLIRGPNKAHPLIFDVVILLMTATVCRLSVAYSLSGKSPERHAGRFPGGGTQTFLTTAFVAILTLAVVAFVSNSIALPHGGWDAWMIWNLRARFIFRGGELWPDAFSQLLSPYHHPDYPLLIPGAIARGWTYIGKETQVVPAAVAMLFTFATVGLLVSSVIGLKGRSAGYFAGLALLSTSNFIILGTYQYADIPLGFFYLTTIIFFYLQDKSPRNCGLSCLAGLAAGLSSWTKNEGLLFLLLVIVIRSAMTIRTVQIRLQIRQMIFFAGAAAPTVSLLVYFKSKYAPPNDLLSAQSLHQLVSRLADYGRYAQIAKTFALVSVATIPVIILLVIYLYIVGISHDETRNIKCTIVILSAVMAGYLIVYMVTPYDLQWHLKTSLSRLLVQLWPSTIFAACMAAQQNPGSFQSRDNDKIHERDFI